MTTFLLVHGAWHGGWAWRDVSDRLRGAGHRVFTPTLTGLGERAHLLSPETGVEQHLADILALIDCEELTDVVLVGHSYGARPTALACAHSAVRSWISLDGVPTAAGATLFDGAPPEAIAAAQAASMQSGTLAGGARAMLPFPAEVIGVPEGHPGHAWVNRRQTPMPWRCLAEAQPPLPARFAQLPRAYVLALGNTLAGPAQGADEARQSGWPMVEINSGHDLMVTAPAETTEALLALAARA